MAAKQFNQSAEYLPFMASTTSRPALPEPLSVDPDWTLDNVLQQPDLALTGDTLLDIKRIVKHYIFLQRVTQKISQYDTSSI